MERGFEVECSFIKKYQTAGRRQKIAGKERPCNPKWESSGRFLSRDCSVLQALDALRDVGEELFGPDLQRRRVPDKREDFIAGLIDIELVDGLLKRLAQRFCREGSFCRPVLTLAHALFQMHQVQLRIPGAVPDQIVPVAPLDPVFPAPAEQGV